MPPLLFRLFFKSPPLARTPVEQTASKIDLLLYLVGLFIVVGIGTLGYVIIEGWNYFDSLYMTVITLTTVGFQEVHPLSDQGRLFTIIMIVIGVGVMMAMLTSLARLILEQQLAWIAKRGSMREKIATLEGHIIVCGYGRLSQIAVQQLTGSGLELVRDRRALWGLPSWSFLPPPFRHAALL